MKIPSIFRTQSLFGKLGASSIGVLVGGVALMVASPAGAAPGGEVHGTVAVEFRDFTIAAAPTPVEIAAPNIKLFLVNEATSAAGPASLSDVDGAFVIPSQPQASYKLCWEAPGFVAGCAAQPVALHDKNINLRPVLISPEDGAIHGRAAFKDGHPCRFVAPLFGINMIAEIVATPASGPAHIAEANSDGYFVIGGLPKGSVDIVAKCEGATVSIRTDVSAATNNLVFPNVTQSLASYAAQSDNIVRSVAAGSTVRVHTEVLSDGGFPLSFQWKVDPPQIDFSSVNEPRVDWKVPGDRRATIYVLSSDGMGGHALSRVALATTPDRIVFSGKVIADNAPVVANAVVTIGGVSGKTDASGHFMVALKGESPNYVVNVEKPGYKLFSRVLHAPVSGATFKLFQAQHIQVDPTKPFRVVEKRDAESQRLSGDDTQGLGVQLQFDANAIGAGTDGRGARPSAPIFLDVGTYTAHEADDQLPGDYAGLDEGGKAKRLSSLGAAHVGIFDAAGGRLNLAPGKTALLRQPIDVSLRAEAPATVPFWSYDETRGVWVEEGVAKRVGNFYEATVTHFSAVNMDLDNNDGACTIIKVDTHFLPPFQLRMTPLTGPGVRPDHQNQWVSDAINVVVREPPNTKIKFDVVDGDGNVLPQLSQTITTGVPSPTGSLWPTPAPAPGVDGNAYSDCTSTLSYDYALLQNYFPKPSPDFTTFLTFLTPPVYLPANGNAAQITAANAATTAYYAKIDPTGTKTVPAGSPGDANDFANWKTANGFNPNNNSADDADTFYFNGYDLALGREMHLKRGGACPSCIAFYVTNHFDAEDALAQVNPAATVAMEYSPAPGQSTNYIKFYVYLNGIIQNSVALDDNGPKFVPALCVICHNGSISSAAPNGDTVGNLTNSRFIPFDLDSFGYPAGSTHQPPNANIETAFKAMNKAVRDSNATPAEVALIQHWYGSETDASLPNANFNGAAVPSGWTAAFNSATPPASVGDQSALYNALVKPYCRSCHITQDDLTWNDYATLDGSDARFRVCPPGQIKMPQAERTYGRFWFGLTPHGPGALALSDVNGGPQTCP